MGNLAIKRGDPIYQIDTPLNSIACIIKGSVTVTNPFEESSLYAGDVIGIIDIDRMVHSNTYIAKEDCILVTYELSSVGQLNDILKDNATLAKCALTSVVRQTCNSLDSYVFKQFECTNLYTFLNDSYDEYKKLCETFVVPSKTLPGLAETTAFQMDDEIENWMISYYDELKELITDSLTDTFLSRPSFTVGLIIKASHDNAKIIKGLNQAVEYMSELATFLLNENHIDFFDLYTSLYYRTLKDGMDNLSLSSTISTFMIHIQSTVSIDKTLAKDRIDAYKKELGDILCEVENGNPHNEYINRNTASLKESVDVILSYAGCSNETTITFKRLLADYKKIIDKNATDSDLKKLRTELTSLFYEIYTAAFQKSLTDKQVPTILQMFFKFGYVDEELAGMENAAYLYSIANSYHGNAALSVYTIYEWLTAIYEGKKEPRRNEFDTDYQGYVHEMVVSKKITKTEEQQLLNDPKQKLYFELTNMFPITNKLTFGRITTFCPLFSEHNVLKTLEDSLVTSDKICGAIEKIREMDFSAFYRETIFFSNELNIQKEMVQTEILPDIILMPNVGTRGVMWQEIEGKRRSSPATYVLPVFAIEGIDLILIRLTGEYRFEMCKRTQGARWNDVSDPSLTSEYFDYIQFYRKNNDLTPDAKEKIKSALTKARNSYKEMFVRDYMTWILYEAKGSPRMNKIARRILFTYCPFPQEVREKLMINPLYKEVIEKWSIKSRHEKHRFNNLLTKLTNSGKEIPPELLKQQQFLEM